MQASADKSFRDSVHGYISVPRCIVSEIVDSDLFQRLQDVEQTGMRPLFPAARHNRFIHSLGVYHLGKCAFAEFRKNAERQLKNDGVNVGADGRDTAHSSHLRESDCEALADQWWNKYGLLFSLACLLHDCAHAPFSHTYEFFYNIPISRIDGDFLDRLEISEQSKRSSLNEKSIHTLDKVLLEECCSTSFVEDYGIFQVNGREIEVSQKPFAAKEHEKLSAAMVGREFRSSISEILKELLPGNVFVAEEYLQDDIEFIARCIIGLRFSRSQDDEAVETSLKNCMITLLNSEMLDVDSLDYTVRDAHNSGIDTGKVDYQRLFRSLTASPVLVFENADFKEDSVEGLWLAGTEAFNPSFANQPTFSVKGAFKLSYSMYDENGSREGDFVKESDTSWFIIDGSRVDSNDANLFESKSGDRSFSIRGQVAPDFKLYCNKHSYFTGEFTGKVSGKLVRESIDSQNPIDESKAAYTEYMLVYDRACLSVIEHAIYARNFEYQWVYTHPQVLYYSSFLLCALLRLSARFLCCKLHKDGKGFGTEALEFDTCEGCQYANQSEPDFQIPRLLGFDSYVSKDTYVSYFESVGYRFYRSSDSDIRALFKNVMIENEQLGNLASKQAKHYLKVFFSRRHQKPLWKTYHEFKEIFSESSFSATDIEHITRLLTEPTKTSQLSFKFLDGSLKNGEVKKLFEKYKICNAVAVSAKLNLKDVDQYNTLTRTRDSRIVRLADISDKIETPRKKSNLFYIYGDYESEDIPSVENLRELFKELLRLG